MPFTAQRLGAVLYHYFSIPYTRSQANVFIGTGETQFRCGGAVERLPRRRFYTYPIAIRCVVLRHSRAACTASTAFGELMVT